MRGLLTVVLILALVAPVVMAAKPSKGQTFQAPKVSEKPDAPPQKEQRREVEYRVVTLCGGKLSARVPVSETR